MGESGYTLGFRRKIAHSGSHAETGAFPSAGTAWLCAANRIALNAAFATPDSTVLLYTYISRFSVNPHYQQTRKIRQSCRHKFYPQLFLVAFSTSPTNGPRSLSRVKVGTHSAFREGSHTAAHTPKQGRFGRGWYHYPRSVPHVHKHPRAGYQNDVLCRFGILAGRCSRRTQKAFGTAMRLCASLSRGVAAPLGCATLLVYRGIYICERSCRVLPIFQSNYQRCR